MTNTQKEYAVTQILPSNGEVVMCFGHKTYCCVEDMDEKPEWHKVTFKFNISMYKLKKETPSDLEESILDRCEVRESWEIETNGQPAHLIGVTKWKRDV